jgi:flagellum-specific ATP synthase
MTAMLQNYFDVLRITPPHRWTGSVRQAIGQLVESEGPFCSVGECCGIRDSNGVSHAGEIVGFRGAVVLSMLLASTGGVRYGDRVETDGRRPSIAVSPTMLGCVIDGAGRSLETGKGYCAVESRPLDSPPVSPLERVPIREPIGCGVRAIDGLLTCGRGQRLGIFGGSGVGKSTLLGMMARGTSADLTVLALIGERGREVREFLEDTLGEEGRRRSVVVVSTSDQSPLLRIRAAMAATAIAEYFCGQGKHVLLVLDSITRLAMAQREVGLAAGEPPTAKGYTPSVFSMLARLVERAGCREQGSITAVYTVLMEGDDQQDPIADAVRSLLDGHILLDRRLTAEGHYPPIHILDSLSRLMPNVCSAEHLAKAAGLRRLLAAYHRSEDLIRIGAYQKGTDPALDRALESLPQINEFLRQGAAERAPLADTLGRLHRLPQ